MSSRAPSAPADPPAAPSAAPAVSSVLFLDWSSIGVQHLKQELLLKEIERRIRNSNADASEGGSLNYF